MTVYVITKGEYSGYHICGVADTPEKAKRMVEFYSDKYEKANIETFDTNELADVFDKGYNLYSCKFSENGEDVNISLIINGWDRDHLTPSVRKWGIKNGKQFYYCDVVAKDEEHAKKILRDKFAEYRYRTEVEES